MKGKLLVTLICAGLMVSLAGAQPEVKCGGLFYVYDFGWMNADFDSDTADGDQHYYLHGDVYAHADFGHGISAKVKLGDLGSFGKHSITGQGDDGMGVHIMEAYIAGHNLFETPIGFKVGKLPLLYGDGMVAFDGGEDGFMGKKLFYETPMFDMDLFWYRLVEGGGTSYIGSWMTHIPDDLDLLGAYGTIKLMEGNVWLSPYFFYRTQTWAGEGDTTYSDNPMWFGARGEGSPAEGLHLKGEFTMMGGENEVWEENYKGMAFMGELNYSLDAMGVPVSFGGAYVSFSGDDTSTVEDCECYESATNGPYTFGFYKGWPGFGPAHTLLTGYGFACCAAWEPMMRNLNVINGHLQYASGPFSIRGDFFMYSRNQAEWGNAETALGNEIGVHMTYNYMDMLTVGAAGGYFMPGEYFGDEADAMMGGYVYLAKGF